MRVGITAAALPGPRPRGGPATPTAPGRPAGGRPARSSTRGRKGRWAGSRTRADGPSARTRCPGAGRTPRPRPGRAGGAATSSPPIILRRRRVGQLQGVESAPLHEVLPARRHAPLHNPRGGSPMSERHALAACTVAAAAFLSLAASPASVGWPQWRGPNRDGVSSETGLQQSWKAGGPAVAWRASGLGTGFSSVSLAGGRIFTMGDVDGAQQLIAVSAADGKRLWMARVGAPWVD